MVNIQINYDCRFFNGSRPCIMNKQKGCECQNCNFYSKYKERILIIKLDALGDVLRTTCIIPKIKEKFPHSFVTWITKTECGGLLLSNQDVDRVISADDAECLSRLQIEEWDLVYNLDNTHLSSALASIAKAGKKIGFFLSKKGIITPTNAAALKWLNMASFDRMKKENKNSYQEIMYRICDFNLPISRPQLFLSQDYINWVEKLISSSVGKEKNPIFIGINTGSGTRWPKKMLGGEDIIELTRTLLSCNQNYYVILLGGLSENDKNNRIAKAVNSGRLINVGCDYSLLQFAAIVKQCGVIVSGDTLALHIASALDVSAVALFGPTSSREIYDYNGLIKKLNVKLDCLCCYGDCKKKDNCMSLFSIEDVISAINTQINYKYV